jgi:tripartite ATP-independent transporter DctM subunit
MNTAATSHAPLVALERALANALKPLCRVSSMLGGLFLFGILVVIVADVLLRTLLHQTFQGTIEIVEALLVIVFFSGMAQVEMADGHIRVDVLTSLFSPFAQKVVDASARLLVFVVVVVLATRCLIEGRYLIDSGYNSGLLEIPIWPFGIASGVFMAIFAFATLLNVVKSMNRLASERTMDLLWLFPAVVVILAMVGASVWPETLPSGFNEITIGIGSVVVLMVLIFLGVHIGAAMAMATLMGLSYLTSAPGAFSLLGQVSQTVSSNYVWSVAPLFMLLGVVVAASEAARDLYVAAYRWWGHWAGGLASATIGACAAFAAVVGDSLSGVVTMGNIALPEMRKYHYDTKLATGAIAVGGSLGILIPPSLGFIVYGLLTEQSIGRLFIAGIVPGLISVAALVGVVTLRCHLTPSLGPAGPNFSFAEKLDGLRKSWPILLLFLIVIGGIWLGLFTPTEAGAVGAMLSIVIALAMRRIRFRDLGNSFAEGVKLTSVVFFIFIYATAFTQFLTVTQLPVALAEYVNGLHMHRYAVLAIVMVVYLLLGCVMNSLPVLILTLPVIFPTIIHLGFDPVWFGVLLVMLVEIGQLTPPIGMSVFALKSVAPDVPMAEIFKGVVPFWSALLVVIVLLAAFPDLVLFLPNLMK